MTDQIPVYRSGTEPIAFNARLRPAEVIGYWHTGHNETLKSLRGWGDLP